MKLKASDYVKISVVLCITGVLGLAGIKNGLEGVFFALAWIGGAGILFSPMIVVAERMLDDI